MPGLSDYPGWLAPILFDGWSVDEWNASQPIELPIFLEKHSLHDSMWYGIWITPNRHATAVIRWDTVIASMEYPDEYSDERWMQWPILLMDFRMLPYQILFDSNDADVHFRPVIGHAASHVVAANDREQILDSVVSQSFLGDNVKQFWLEKTLHHTVIEGSIESEIHIFHAPEVRLLCKSFDGEILQIPDL